MGGIPENQIYAEAGPGPGPGHWPHTMLIAMADQIARQMIFLSREERAIVERHIREALGCTDR